MKKILVVFGTRPEAIKMAPLTLELLREKSFSIKVCITAQHRHMLDEVLELFKIKPEFDLNIMQESQTLSHITTETIKRLEKVFSVFSPDMTLIHGDTTTTFAAALASFYHKIPVGHVEAGLRTYNKLHPFPEEGNRVLADHLCAMHFAPTKTAASALKKENISDKSIFITGNTVIDALCMALKQKKEFTNPVLKKLFASPYPPINTPDYGFRGQAPYQARGSLFGGSPRAPIPFILLTCHRRENFGKPLQDIFNAVKSVALKHDIKFIYPVHPNPNIACPAKKILGNLKNVLLIEPLNYFDLIKLLKNSFFIVSDSGGIQEEAPSLGKPVLVLREFTERPEAVRAGAVKVIGTDYVSVKSEIEKLLTSSLHYKKMSAAVNPYGDGQASRRIVQGIKYYFGLTKKRPPEFK